MPYLAFKQTDGKSVELSANTETQMVEAIDKNGQIADADRAKLFVKAFFCTPCCTNSQAESDAGRGQERGFGEAGA